MIVLSIRRSFGLTGPRHQLRGLLIAAILLIRTPFLLSQQITSFEYFIDTDPGFGQGIAVPIAPGQGISNLVFALPVAMLSPGFHTLFVRSKDENHAWSLTASRPFYLEPVLSAVNSDIIHLEYFLDDDPGFGHATSVSITPASNLNNVVFPLNSESLTPGFHQLFIRSKDSEGRWSVVAVRPFFREYPASSALLPITRFEYFIDNDPGIGMGIQVPVSPALTIDNLMIPIVSDTLLPGFHQLFIRSQNAGGSWSMTASRTFFCEKAPPPAPAISRAEYFIDTDPGSGYGIPISVPAGSTQATLVIPLPVSGLGPGFHRLSIRTRDDSGHWSLAASHPFYVADVLLPAPDITRAEYFIDSDPGYGMATSIPVSPAPHLSNFHFVADLIGQTYGQHQLFFRTRDSLGKWGLTQVNTITYTGFEIIATGPLHVCPGQVVVLKAPSSHGKNYQWHHNGLPINGAVDSVYNAPDTGSYFVCLSAPGCINDTSNSLIVTHKIAPATPVISGPLVTCPLQSGTIYSTIEGMSAYVWALPTGGTIVSGGGLADHEVTVMWNQPGMYTLSVSTGDTSGCFSFPQGSLEITVNSPPSAAGLISGPTLITWGQQNVLYSVDPVSLATGYIWSIPPGWTLTSGWNSSSITVNAGTAFSSGQISVLPVNVCGTGMQSPPLLITGVAPVPATINLQNLSFPSGTMQCFNATQTILVSGPGKYFIVSDGAQVTLVSGSRILLREGTTVMPGGSLYGYITLSGQYCINLKTGTPINPVLVEQDGQTAYEAVTGRDFICYPNPTTGLFYIRFTGKEASFPVSVTLFGPHGEKIQSTMLHNETPHELSLVHEAPGLYYVRIIHAGESTTLKVIRF